jgi:PTH1 family peptidyl-tRNA hydrolase
MNDSGNAVGPLARKYAITDPAKIIVVHDELDLEPGVVRVKIGGGLAGHNGLRSINQHLKTQDFIRVRIGVGKPSTKEDGADHVLSKVSGSQRQTLDISVQIAADAVQLICTQGVDAAMQSINSK